MLALETDPGLHIVAEAADLAALTDLCVALGPDCAVVRSGPGDSPSQLTALRTTCPGLALVAVVAPDDIAEALAALRAGATGFVPRTSLGEVPAVVRAVTAGTAALPPLVAASLLDVADPRDGPPFPLADEERAVLAHLAAGRTYRAAAEALGVGAGRARALVAGAVARLQGMPAPGRGAGSRADPGR